MKTIQHVLVESKPVPKKATIPDRVLNDIQEDWVNYGKNLGLRVAAIDDEESRDDIRHQIEQLIFKTKQELKKKKSDEK